MAPLSVKSGANRGFVPPLGVNEVVSPPRVEFGGVGEVVPPPGAEIGVNDGGIIHPLCIDNEGNGGGRWIPRRYRVVPHSFHDAKIGMEEMKKTWH